MSRLRLATRGSALALAQSRGVAARLQAARPGLEVELLIVRSEGDQRSEVPLAAAGGQGLFTKALEETLLQGEADLAVHSLKDLPTALAPGLALAAVPAREDWRDAWLSPGAASPWELPAGARVGTGSPRRRAQLRRRHPGLAFAELRGNLDTRLAKLERGEVEGAVLALAGLKRLGLQGRARHLFSEEEMLPAPGQGFLGLETRAQGEARDLARALNEAAAEGEAACERAFLARMQMGCQAPLGALARRRGGQLWLKAFAELEGRGHREAEREGPAEAPEALGRALAEALLEGGR